METPSSTRRVTGSQALDASGNSNNIPMSKNVEGTVEGNLRSRQRTGNQQDRPALIDITNDSPIVGLAKGNLETPSSNFSKKRISSQCTNNSDTPGSGEALLRGQVKTLLQKVEEEAELSKFSLDNIVNGPFLHLKGLVNSPMALLAPTPNNTPHVSNLSGNENAENNGLASVTSSPVQEHFTISQMVTEIFDGQKKQESVESDKSLITRSLLFDFNDKSDDSSDCTSELTYQGGGSAGSKVKSSTDDDASIWSIQVYTSTRNEEEDDVEDEVDIEEDNDYYEGEEGEEEEYGDDGMLDDLCEGLSKISVNGTKFTRKHTRFVYNSDDELEGEEDCLSSSADSPGVLCLKGLPTPKGKHFALPY